MFVANRVLYLNLAGMYGALLIIPKNLRIMSIAVGGVWGPSILAKYSRSDRPGMDKITLVSIKLTGLTLALVVGLICGLADPFLSVWLGPEFQAMVWILVVMIFPLSTNMVVGPFFNIQISNNKLKMPALIALGLLNLLLAILLTPRYRAMGIVAAGMLSLTLNNSIYAPLYAAKIMNLPWWHYLKRLGVVVVATLGVAVVSYLFSVAIPLISYLHLIVTGGLVSLVYLTLVYSLWLNGEEKNLLKIFLRFDRR